MPRTPLSKSGYDEPGDKVEPERVLYHALVDSFTCKCGGELEVTIWEFKIELLCTKCNLGQVNVFHNGSPWGRR